MTTVWGEPGKSGPNCLPSMETRCRDAMVQTKTRVPRTIQRAAISVAWSQSRWQASCSSPRASSSSLSLRNSAVPEPAATRRRSYSAASARRPARASWARTTPSSWATCCSRRKWRLQGPRLSGLPRTAKGRCRRTASSFSHTASTAWFVTQVTQAVRSGGTLARRSPKMAVLLPVPGGPWMTSRRWRRLRTAWRWGPFSSPSAPRPSPSMGWKLPGLALAGMSTIASSSRSTRSLAPLRAAA
mmetsp:Transcript_169810/g.412779  ORF Transcript_169810/g.412779 Transcript_169810/m.412779 type:complete len:243 (+) Transcript_169810:1307-2035(+)